MKKGGEISERRRASARGEGERKKRKYIETKRERENRRDKGEEERKEIKYTEKKGEGE